MKKTTLTILCFLLIASFVKSQTANYDNVLVCPMGGGSTFAFPLYNDTVPAGNIVLTSLDLDQSLAGVQSTVMVNGILFTADTSGMVTWSGPGLGPNLIDYTFSDDLGNTSNVAILNVYFDPPILVNPDEFYDYCGGNTTPSVSNNDYVAGGGISFAVVTFPTTYPGFTMNGDGTITIASGTPAGTYVLNYNSSSPACPYLNDITVTIHVTPEIGLNVVGTYSDYNADGYTSVGDVIDYQYSINNISTSAINTVGVSSPTGGILGSPIAVLNAGVSDTTTFTSKYILTQNDINTAAVITKIATASGSSSFGISSATKNVSNSLSISNGIKLNAFFDTNGNGVQNSGEVNLNIGQFLYEINSDGVIHNIASSSGSYYLYESNPTTTYNLSYALDPAFATYYNLTTSSYPSVTVAAGSGITTYNFPIVAGTLFNDLSVALLPYGAWPRPGFVYKNRVKYTNFSNQTIPSGTVSFNCSSVVSILSIVPTATTSTATNFTYNFINLLPFESRYIDVTMQVPTIPTVALGDLVANSASIVPTAGDLHPLDNTSNLTQTIVGSYDPNDKVESHGQEILYSSFTSNDYLTYTIQFENTGTANAVNVRVNDILDSQLDETSIKIIDASHSYVLDRVGSNLNFKFEAIDLPPSIADTTIGKGYVVFQVKPKSGFAVGDIIPNTANIYFDFNPAIVTNTWSTEFVPLLGINHFDNNASAIYPNPSNGKIIVASNDTIKQIEIYDLNGRMMLSSAEKAPSVSLNIERFSNGIYLLKIATDSTNTIYKIIKN